MINSPTLCEVSKTNFSFFLISGTVIGTSASSRSGFLTTASTLFSSLTSVPDSIFDCKILSSLICVICSSTSPLRFIILSRKLICAVASDEIALRLAFLSYFFVCNSLGRSPVDSTGINNSFITRSSSLKKLILSTSEATTLCISFLAVSLKRKASIEKKAGLISTTLSTTR